MLEPIRRSPVIVLAVQLMAIFLFMHQFNSFPPLTSSSAMMILNGSENRSLIGFHLVFYVTLEILLLIFLLKLLQVIPIQRDLRLFSL